MRIFLLAPMDGMLRWMTRIVFLLPVSLVWFTSRGGPQAHFLFMTTGFVTLVYASVWFWWRPSYFEITPKGVTIVFPLRRRFIPRESIIGARALDKSGFKERYGWGMRVGAGGLWGGFGFLLTSKRGRLDFYVTRTDRWALIERSGAPDLLLSADPLDDFVADVREQFNVGGAVSS